MGVPSRSAGLVVALAAAAWFIAAAKRPPTLADENPLREDGIPFGEPFYLGGIGARGLVDFEKHDILVTVVEEGSPAAEAGLAVRDRIVGLKVAGVGTVLFKDLSSTESPLTLLVTHLTRAAAAPPARARLGLLVARDGRQDVLTVKPERGKKHAASCPRRCKQCRQIVEEALGVLARAGDTAADLDDKPKSLAAQTVDAAVQGLAFLASGTTPHGGAYVESLRRRMKTVVIGAQAAIESCAAYEKEGAEPQLGGGKMENWMLGFAGLFLAELYAAHGPDALSVSGVQYRWSTGGWTSPPAGAVRDLLGQIAKRLAANQEKTGGWSHGGPRGMPNKLNYIEVQACGNWCLAALGRIREVGVPVPEEALGQAVQYVRTCSAPDGGIFYSHKAKGSAQIGRTCGTAFAFWCGGVVGDPLFEEMRRYIDRNIEHLPDGHASPTMHFLACGLGASRYGMKSETWGTFWEEYIPKMESLRRPDGGFVLWPSDVGNDPRWGGLIPESQLPRTWPTAVHALILQLPEETLFKSSRKRRSR